MTHLDCIAHLDKLGGQHRRSRIPAVLATLLFAIALTGCAKPTLMPTPIVFDQSGVDPFKDTPKAMETTNSQVFIATDREPSGKTDPATFYSKKRSKALWLSLAEVDLGKGMTWDELHEQSLTSSRTRKPTIGLLAMDHYGALWSAIPGFQADDEVVEENASPFLAAVHSKLEASQSKEIFIFVHGFNTAFDANTELAAELFHYLGDDGVFMSYEWPSRHNLFSYSKDKANAQYSTRYFRQFLHFLAERTDVKRINILGHSAGAPVAVGAVAQLRLMHAEDEVDSLREHCKIGQLALFAPDMDLAQFINDERDGLTDVTDNTTIYISTRDKALDFSAWIYGFARLGNPMEALTSEHFKDLRTNDNMDVIDVAAAEKKHGSFLGHSYFHKDPWVSSDMLMMLRHGASPESRGLIRTEENPVWQFPTDYPERARAAARSLYDQ